MDGNDKLLRDLYLQNQKNSVNIQRKKSKLGKKILKFFIWLIVFALILFIFFYLHGINVENNGLSWINKIPVIGQIKKLAESTSAPLEGETSGRVNVLILGLGGKNHEGALLTDTIMVVSFDLKTNKVAMLSIPRDMVAPYNGGWPKINAINSYAEQNEPDSGGRVVSQVLSKVLDADINYHFTIDFSGFKTVIDELGGVEIYIENTFDDYHYPILGEEENPNWDARFEHLHFDQGWQKMDGELALKYSRSRYASGAEGNDFARAARQQKIIRAIRDKALSKSTWFNPRLISSLINQIEDNINTNMNLGEMLRLWSMFKDTEEENIINKVLSNRPSGLLADAVSQDGAYTLQPRTGDFSEVQYLFSRLFYQIPENEKLKVVEENVKLVVLNGTFVPGLAGKTATDLENYGFQIAQIANASKQDFEVSVIYDLSANAKPEAVKILKAKLGANISDKLPDWLQQDLATAKTSGALLLQPDLILILGADATIQPNLSTENVNI